MHEGTLAELQAATGLTTLTEMFLQGLAADAGGGRRMSAASPATPSPAAGDSVAPRRPADAQGAARDAPRPPHDRHAGADAAARLSAAQPGLQAVPAVELRRRPSLRGWRIAASRASSEVVVLDAARAGRRAAREQSRPATRAVGRPAAGTARRRTWRSRPRRPRPTPFVECDVDRGALEEAGPSGDIDLGVRCAQVRDNRAGGQSDPTISS